MTAYLFFIHLFLRCLESEVVWGVIFGMSKHEKTNIFCWKNLSARVSNKTHSQFYVNLGADYLTVTLVLLQLTISILQFTVLLLYLKQSQCC